MKWKKKHNDWNKKAFAKKTKIAVFRTHGVTLRSYRFKLSNFCGPNIAYEGTSIICILIMQIPLSIKLNSAHSTTSAMCTI